MKNEKQMNKKIKGYEVIKGIEEGNIKDGALIVDNTFTCVAQVANKGLIWKPDMFSTQRLCDNSEYEIVYVDDKENKPKNQKIEINLLDGEKIISDTGNEENFSVIQFAIDRGAKSIKVNESIIIPISAISYLELKEDN